MFKKNSVVAMNLNPVCIPRCDLTRQMDVLSFMAFGRTAPRNVHKSENGPQKNTHINHYKSVPISCTFPKYTLKRSSWRVDHECQVSRPSDEWAMKYPSPSSSLRSQNLGPHRSQPKKNTHWNRVSQSSDNLQLNSYNGVQEIPPKTWKK